MERKTENKTTGTKSTELTNYTYQSTFIYTYTSPWSYKTKVSVCNYKVQFRINHKPASSAQVSKRFPYDIFHKNKIYFGHP